VHRIAEEANRQGCVALHAHFGWSGRAARSAAAHLGIPLLTTFYGRDLADRKRRWARHPVYERLFREGALFFCEGPAMFQHLSQLGCPEDKIRIARIGIDLALFPFGPAQRKRPLVVVQVARLVEKKGVDVAIHAFAAARRRIGAGELWIVGDGELRADLERLASRAGVGRAVRFLGELSHAECREVVRCASIAIQPSRTAADGDTEGGAPTVLLEMQAAGIPVAATRHADIPFVVEAEDCIVDEEDVEGLAHVLVRLAGLSDAEWRDRTMRARQFIEANHDARLVAKSIEGYYSEAIAAFDFPGARTDLISS
jgi:colanic acid/amylovoran biosynthesis glycosyltransferase